ncbi:hypothetical protein A0J61_09773 [Choanephora cucurbitarum]|uniref:ATP-dependent DNA helicase n=1 Tax=Choanephora cucurbitarum TaxID=101091 RepID=A0A1C7MZH7_9FUNG|nr:hypothetical protein A0J61_09773 [Choanephora cucurbitarum]
MEDEDPVLLTVPFGGKLIVFGGDFRQVLPVITKASRSTITSECINRSFLWPKVTVLKLRANIHVQQTLQSNNPSLAKELQEFSEFLLNIGEGKVPTLTLNNNIFSD